MQFTIIGNPENRRVTAFCAAVQQLGHGMPLVIPYASWLPGNAHPFIPAAGILKIDSPGENDQVRQLLIQLGGGTIESNEHGIIGNMQSWYKGYCQWLQQVQTIVSEQPLLQVMNQPADIQLQFNKPACQQLLQQHGVPVPTRLPAFQNYEELLALMQQHGMQKVFIKPAHASSASGVIAFRRSGHRVQAVTSAEIVQTADGIQLYNSLNVRTYMRELDISQLINRMVSENVFAEAWLPKATLNERYFDVRVLVIAGKARHTVIRTSGHVITNLHLGNKRGELDDFYRRMGAAAMQRIHHRAEQAAACFPDSLYMGIDILLTADHRHVLVLEINAFGDLLPGLVDNGETCYEAQINAMIKKQERVVC